ncbi:MAG TPA: antibiotic biosynthesis monooxygenase [Novosphingobium sp.]|nr:antibiotic biosynthesis monooxygenase [Novosphingobium sp.]
MHLVVFRNRKRADLDEPAYATDAARTEALAMAQPGFVSFKSYLAADGEVVAISEWESENAALSWGRHADHAGVQARGRADYYASYTLFSCPDPRVHHFEGT